MRVVSDGVTVWNIRTAVGEDFNRMIALRIPEGEFIDLTGYEFRGHVREYEGAPGPPIVALQFGEPIPHPVTMQANAVVEVSIPRAMTIGISIGTYAYDIWVIDPAGMNRKKWRGTFTVEGSVTI